MNARGIPTAAYRVLHLLSCTGGCTPSLWGVTHLGYPHQTWPGVPHPYQGVTPPRVAPSDLARGYPIPCWGVPHLGYPHQTWLGVLHTCWGGTQGRYPPQLDLAGVPPTGPGWGTPLPIGPGWGTPLPIGPGWGTPSWIWLGYPLVGPGQGTPPRGVDRQTPVKTVPYRRTTYAVRKNYNQTLSQTFPSKLVKMIAINIKRGKAMSIVLLLVNTSTRGNIYLKKFALNLVETIIS